MLKDTLQQDLKAAMLARETEKVETLKGLKSAILYVEVDANKRDQGLNDNEVLAVLKKESKKRTDAIALYEQGNNVAMAAKERAEKELIDSYLPQQLSEDEVNAIINEAVSALQLNTIQRQDMGKVIGYVKNQAGSQADGSVIAKLVQGRIAS